MKQQQHPLGSKIIPYMDLGGGLNTRAEPHAVQRNELTVSINGWPAFDQSISLRPGSIPIGNSGTGKPCVSLHAARFNDTTYVVEVKKGGAVFAGLAAPGATFTLIGHVNANVVFTTAAQMFDPTVTPTGAQCLFICDGLSIPQYWAGPGKTLQPVAFGANTQTQSPPGWGLPAKPGGEFPITPQYVTTLGNNSHLFYSGDPSVPNGVYISDPFYPQAFNSPAMQVDATGGKRGANDPFIPAIIGNNDGVEGGPITGLKSLGSVMVVFEQCAVYYMTNTTLLGEIPAWQVVQVSNNRGCQSPRSIVAFDTFITFLAIDGVYATDANSVWQISGDVPSFFDSSLTGQPAIIANKTTAIGCRHGTRLLLFFVGLSTPATSGLWFEFAKPSATGNPIAGQIEGMNVGGMVELTGPKDDGNVVWSDAGMDNVAKFGLGSADLGPNNTQIPINFMIQGKADLMDDVFGPEAVIGTKQVTAGYALIEAINAAPGVAGQLQFQGAWLTDGDIQSPQYIAQSFAQNQSPVGVWGTGVWGKMLWGGTQPYGFARVKMPAPGKAKGHLVQFAVTCSSVVPFVMIGFALYANLQPVNY